MMYMMTRGSYCRGMTSASLLFFSCCARRFCGAFVFCLAHSAPSPRFHSVRSSRFAFAESDRFTSNIRRESHAKVKKNPVDPFGESMLQPEPPSMTNENTPPPVTLRTFIIETIYHPRLINCKGRCGGETLKRSFDGWPARLGNPPDQPLIAGLFLFDKRPCPGKEKLDAKEIFFSSP